MLSINNNQAVQSTNFQLVKMRWKESLMAYFKEGSAVTSYQAQ